MIRLDKRSPAEIKKVITWCQKDKFWMNNILSTEKLRKQFDTLALQMEGYSQCDYGSAPYHEERL